MKKAWVLSYSLSAQRRLWSDWADAQADLSLRWAHTHFVGFVMTWLNYVATMAGAVGVTAYIKISRYVRKVCGGGGGGGTGGFRLKL